MKSYWSIFAVYLPNILASFSSTHSPHILHTLPLHSFTPLNNSLPHDFTKCGIYDINGFHLKRINWPGAIVFIKKSQNFDFLTEERWSAWLVLSWCRKLSLPVVPEWKMNCKIINSVSIKFRQKEIDWGVSLLNLVFPQKEVVCCVVNVILWLFNVYVCPLPSIEQSCKII